MIITLMYRKRQSQQAFLAPVCEDLSWQNLGIVTPLILVTLSFFILNVMDHRCTLRPSAYLTVKSESTISRPTSNPACQRSRVTCNECFPLRLVSECRCGSSTQLLTFTITCAKSR